MLDIVQWIDQKVLSGFQWVINKTGVMPLTAARLFTIAYFAICIYLFVVYKQYVVGAIGIVGVTLQYFYLQYIPRGSGGKNPLSANMFYIFTRVIGLIVAIPPPWTSPYEALNVSGVLFLYFFSCDDPPPPVRSARMAFAKG